MHGISCESIADLKQVPHVWHAQPWEEHIARADILVSCAGRPGFVRGAWLKPGAVIIDVGMNAAWLQHVCAQPC